MRHTTIGFGNCGPIVAFFYAETIIRPVIIQKIVKISAVHRRQSSGFIFPSANAFTLWTRAVPVIIDDAGGR